MGAVPVHFRRFFWAALPLLAVLVFLAAGRAAGADPAAPNADDFLYLPYIGRPPLPPQIELTPFVAGFDDVTIMDIANAGDERLFIANREGKVWVVYPDGRIAPTLFLDVSKDVQHEVNFEQGFLGLAFHPDFPDTPYFYYAYTTPAHIQVARGAVDPAQPNVADAHSLVSLLSIRKPPASGGPSPVHNGGDLTFGPDGYLYIPVGDGGPDPYDPLGVPGDPNNHAQRRDVLLGSILRIDPNPERGLAPDCGVAKLYSIPRDNPWLGDAGCDELWAKGLRNPWRIAIDRPTGDFYIADVGEWRAEEVNFYPGDMPGGANFGWHCWEGTTNYTAVFPILADDCPDDTTFTFPVHQYDHSQGECSIIGGSVYRGAQYPSLYGRYFFGDWCSGRLWTMVREGGQWRVDAAGRLPIPFSTFGVDIHGELYGGSYHSGTLYKVVIH